MVAPPVCVTLQSALSRPRNRWADGKVDISTPAATYAYGMARNHPGTDGHKRTAWAPARLFLALGDIRILFAPEAAIQMVLSMAADTLSEPDVAECFKARQA